VALSPRRRRGPASSGVDLDEPITPIEFRLEADVATRVADDGKELLGRGYVICDCRTGSPLGDDDFFFRIGGGIVTDIVGVDGHLDDLQRAEFGPGRALSLARRSPGGAEDCIDVMDAGRTLVCGRLPADAADVVSLYGTDGYDAALALWEWRNASGTRVGLRVLLAPGWTVEELV
jgi:hypothetical protein